MIGGREGELQVGGRIRRLRRARRVAQTDLATALGISASYLNLIEHNRRRVSVDLLFRIARHFGIEPGELADGDEAQLAGDLMEMYADELLADSEITNMEVKDFASSHPAAARSMLMLYDRLRESRLRVTVDARDSEPFHRATDAISDFLQTSNNHFPELEAAAERIGREIASSGDGLDAGMRTYLANAFGIDIDYQSLGQGIVRHYAPTTQTLGISDLLPPSSARFLVAQHLARASAEPEITHVIECANLLEGELPILARNVLSSYVAAAIIMPYEPFLKDAGSFRYDIERLAHRYGASFEQICHRLTTLQRRGAAGIPFHLVRTDIAGNISKRFTLSGIHIPRHSGACPRWNVYSAFLSPGRINVQVSEMPDGQRYFCIAQSISKGAYRYNALARHLAIGIGCHIDRARELVYADGVDLDSDRHVVPIGVSCRICPRMACAARAHPPADHRFQSDDTVRPETHYSRMA